jgi:hypothetical protein
MTSADHRWEWRLPEGGKVEATLDAADKIESVFVDGRLVSQAARGSMPDGHVLEKPAGVVVRFQPGALICILRVDGEEVSPNVWPVKKRVERPKPNVVTLPLRAIAIAVGAVAVIGGAYWAWSSRAANADAERGAASSLDATFRADNGRFVAHHPKRFVARRAQVPVGASGVVLLDAQRSESIVIVAHAGGDAPSEPWLVQKKLHAEALTNLPRNGPAYEESSRGDETCLGKPGAVVLGRSRTARGEPANVWSCGFAHDGASYLVMSSLRADSPSEDGRRLREIIEATELTHLAELQGQ